jgi:hypothetical protein
MSTKTKKATPVKQTAKPAAKKQAAKKPAPKKSVKKSNNKKGMQPMQDAPVKSQIEVLLETMIAKLSELVQIETYCAEKIAAKYEAPVAPAVAAPAAVAPAAAPASIPAAPAPGVAAAPAAPATRPGQGTIGGLVWEYCDGLNSQLGKAPTKDEVIAAVKQYSPVFNGQPINELTVSTQYSKWRSAQGLPRLPRGFGANKPAAAPAPVATPAPAPSAMALPLPAPAAAPAFVPPVAAPVAPPVAPQPAPVATSLPPWLRSV